MKTNNKLYVVVSTDSDGRMTLVENVAFLNRANAENAAKQLNAPDNKRLENAYSTRKFYEWKTDFARRTKSADVSFNAEWVMRHFAELDRQKVDDTFYRFSELDFNKYKVKEIVVND